MTEDQQREAFEGWMDANNGGVFLGKFARDSGIRPGEYIDHEAQFAWEAWQAACRWANTPDHPPR